jgi:Arc/MetJ family transcription regulator
MSSLPICAKETLVEWANKIGGGLGPISGRNRDALDRLLRAAAARVQQLTSDRDDQDRALRDAIRETAATADELAFWRYQAIWGRTYLLQPAAVEMPFMEDGPVWKEALRQLEAARAAELAETRNADDNAQERPRDQPSPGDTALAEGCREPDGPKSG